MPPALEIYRRFLPNWRRDGAVYFVTWRLERDGPSLTVRERGQVTDVIRHFEGQRYTLFAYVVMNDHVHVIVQPHRPFRLETILHSWKAYSTSLFHRETRRGHGRIWQREYFDRIIRNEEEFDQKVQYILANPFLRWPGIEQYPWVWCREELRE